MSLSSLIVQREIATIRQVEEALARQVLYGGDLVTNLLEVAKLDEATLTFLLAESFGLQATLGAIPECDERARTLVPAELASARAMVPLEVEDGVLVVAVAEPLPREAIEELTFALGLRVAQRIAPMVRVREALAKTYGAPLERRLQRLLARLGDAPVAAPAQVAGAVVVVPDSPSLKPPFRSVLTPSPEAAAIPAPRASRPTSMGFPATAGPGPDSSQPFPAVSAAVAAEATQPDSRVPVIPAAPVGAPAAAVAAPGPERPERPETPDTARGTLVQKGGAGARPPRRRRGPITPDNARKELEEVADRDAILDLFFDYARQYFDYSAMFVVHGDIAEGREAYGDGASRERVQAIGVPLDLPSILSAARDARSAVRVMPADDGLDPVLIADLERDTKGEVLIVPIVVRTRSVALLYGDSGDDGVDAAAVKEVVTFGLMVGQAFEKLIVRKKFQGYITSGQAPPASRVESAPAPSSPRREPAPRSPRGAASEPPLSSDDRATPLVSDDRDTPLGEIPSDPDPPPSSGPPTQPSSAPPPPVSAMASSVPHGSHAAQASHAPPMATPALSIETKDDSDAPPASSELLALALDAGDRPPPANVMLVRRPSGPPIPREEPSDSDKPPPTPTIPDSSPAYAPASESFAVAPHRPPTPRAGEPASLPSVIVDVDEEFGALVDRVVSMGTDEAAEAELIRQGPKAMPAIMSRFPGPTVVDRARVEEGALRVAECGPVLRLIAGQRRAALPFVLPLVGDGEPQRRYWATFLITELAYAEAVEPVVPRLFDPDPSVRRVARLAARAVAEVAPEALMERLVRYYRDPSLSNERRIEMIETLGELRERLAVPLLIEALGDAEEPVAAAARRALMTVTRQDLGRDAKKWQAWWAQNAGRHRVEWLIDALMHEVPAIRRAAGDELKAVTKEYFGYYDDLPRKDREKAQQRYREWWAAEGRMRFQRR